MAALKIGGAIKAFKGCNAGFDFDEKEPRNEADTRRAWESNLKNWTANSECPRKLESVGKTVEQGAIPVCGWPARFPEDKIE